MGKGDLLEHGYRWLLSRSDLIAVKEGVLLESGDEIASAETIAKIT